MPNHQLSRTRCFAGAALLCLAALLSTAAAQEVRPKPAATPQDDVIRISTELVQTDVTVLDKRGRFVDDLKREQFELLVDGHPQPITFFELVQAGSTNEGALTARGTFAQPGTPIITQQAHGRVIFFFVDDMHMSPGSLIRVRKTIHQFIERDMGPNDQVAITSANGQVGFLQQLTDNKVVLRAAVERLKQSAQQMRDLETPTMTEMMAQAIDVYEDPNVLKVFTEPLIAKGMPAQAADGMVRARAKRVLQESYQLTRFALTTLESLTQSSSQLPGRKLVFFISDGFKLNQNESDVQARIRNITNGSAKNGIVIYTMDARGLPVSGFGVADSNDAVASNPRGDAAAAVMPYAMRDVSADQEPLRMIAANTGGRALLNSNSLNQGFMRAIRETSRYYLLAWRPPDGTSGKDKFRTLEVRLTGRPDLNVQVRRGYYDVAAQPVAKVEQKSGESNAVKKTPAEDLRQAISSPYPTNALPTQLGLVFVHTPDKGPVLTASVQVSRQYMEFNRSEDKQSATLDLSGVVLNDQGKPVAGFKDKLEVAVWFPQYVGQPRRDLVYNFQQPLPPGLYQVRVAARDGKTGRTGSAIEWIEIPDLSKQKLSLGSLILGESPKEVAESADPLAVVSVDKRFPRSSRLRLLTYVYNAARGANGATPPDVALQVEVLRNEQTVLTNPFHKIEVIPGGNPSAIPYAAEFPLASLAPGRYVLQVTAIDRISKATVSQSAGFDVE
ncbi:MAG TPA: VWA domain-containing protein [Pyrinomonadaceae bacterium]|nr:VWA domain-containing protein [Pyrinomonadaceae bacterium]